MLSLIDASEDDDDDVLIATDYSHSSSLNFNTLKRPQDDTIISTNNIKRTKPNSPAPCSPTTHRKRILSREKQIIYGKATIGYSEYLRLVPYKERSATQPRTPNINLQCSKRCWDGLVARWRRQLHAFDPVD